MLRKIQEGEAISSVQTTFRSWYHSLHEYFSTAHFAQSSEVVNASVSLDSANLTNQTNVTNALVSRSKKTSRQRSRFEANIVPSMMLEPNHIKNSESTAFHSTWKYFSELFTAQKSEIQKKPDINDLSAELNNKMELLENKIKELLKRLTDKTISEFDKKRFCEEIDKLALQKINLVEDQIVMHATRRVDLFFYLMLAVYNKNLIIEKGETTKQNGMGSKKRGTQACHCSIFPNVIFRKIEEPHSSSRLYSFFNHPKEMRPTIFTLLGTHFAEILNMTMELPSFVNNFDGHLEGRSEQTSYVRDCLNILNKVSQNIWDPIKGMNEFFKVMNAFFSYIEYKYIKHHELILQELQENKEKIHKENIDFPNAFKRIWELEKKGTFIPTCFETQKISFEYLYMMLRLNKTERALCSATSLFLPKFYERIQNEIFQISSCQKSVTLS